MDDFRRVFKTLIRRLGPNAPVHPASLMNQHAPHTGLLKSRLSALKRLVPEGAPVVHFDYAVYHNVGDILISCATEAFFRDNGNRISDSYCIQNYRKALSKQFSPDTVFVFQGGGNFGDVHKAHQRLREDVMRAHPAQQAVIFPQTVFFKDPKSLESTAALFARFENLTICGRDQISVAMLQQHFHNNIEALPDIAHYLDGAIAQHGQTPPAGTLYFVRQDHPGFANADIDAIAGAPQDSLLDWPGFLSAHDWRMMKAGHYLHRLDEKTLHTPLPLALWRAWRTGLVIRAFRLFQEHEEVVTNRLHGLILAMLCAKPVRAFETGHGKLTTYYQSWLRDDPSVSIDEHCEKPSLMAALANQ